MNNERTLQRSLHEIWAPQFNHLEIPPHPVTNREASSVCPLTSRADSCLAWGIRAGSLFEMPSTLNNQMLSLSAPPRHHFISNTRTREIYSVALDVHRMGSETHTHTHIHDTRQLKSLAWTQAFWSAYFLLLRNSAAAMCLFFPLSLSLSLSVSRNNICADWRELLNRRHIPDKWKAASRWCPHAASHICPGATSHTTTQKKLQTKSVPWIMGLWF